ncbi:MAG: hypothetical protein KDJ65_36775 [Anaerolineae bacterium]|nr:hypothetical protein [Anaerolineae bacterium]
MATIKLDTAGQYLLRFPSKKTPSAVVDNVRTFVKHELSLPPEARLPHTPHLAELLRQWDENKFMRSEAEHQRTVAAEDIQELDAHVRRLVRHIHRVVAALMFSTPAQTTRWGFRYKQKTGNILLPETRQQHLSLLERYITYEQSLPAAEQLPQPSLAEVMAVYEALQEQLRNRRIGKSRRKRAVAAGRPIIEAMHFYLQTAVSHLLTFQFKGTVTPDLREWGYDVKLSSSQRRPNAAGWQDEAEE